MHQREDLELLILKHRYPAYTPDIRKIFIRDGDKGVSCEVIQEIWECHRPSLESFRDFGIAIENDTGQQIAYRNGQLTEGVMEALTQYFTKANAYDLILAKRTVEELLVEESEIFKKQQAKRTEAAADRDVYAWFNRPDCEIDYTHWSGVSHFTYDQAVALVLGKDPRKVYAEALKPFKKVSRSLFTEKYGNLLAQVSSYPWKDSPNGLVSLQELENWTHSRKIETRFKHDEGRDGDSKLTLEQNIDKRVLHSLYIIITFFLIKTYNFDIFDLNSEKNSDIIKNIAREVIEEDINLTDKTIRKHILAAHKYVLAERRSIFREKSKRSK